MRPTKVFLASLLTALALGAVAASSALAIEAEALVEDQTLSELKLEEFELTVSGGPITISAPSSKVVIKCQKVGGSGGLVKGGTEKFSATLTECKVTEPASCTVTEPVTVKAKAEFVEAGEKLYEKWVSQEEGKPLATLTFNKECSLKETQLKGSVISEGSQGPAEKFTYKFIEALSKELKETLGTELKFGTAEAFLSGELATQLGGAGAGEEAAISVRTKLCKEQRRFCPSSPNKIWPKETEVSLTNEGSMRLVYGATVVTCTEAVLSGPTNEEAGVPLWGAFGTSFFAGCTDGGGEECTAFVTGQPFSYSITALAITVPGSGALWFKGMKVTLECPGARTCVYKVQNGVNGMNTADLFVKGGAPAKAEHSPFYLVKEPTGSELLCTSLGLWEGATENAPVKFKFPEPSPMWPSS